MLRKFLFLTAGLLSVTFLTGCFDDNDDDKKANEAWKAENEQYFRDMESLTENGVKVYTPMIPSWQPNSTILFRRHNSRPETPGITPLYNSTVDIKYTGYTMDDVNFDNSFSLNENGDSIYRTQPSSLVPGFAYALFNMQKGDSVTVIIPYELAYGAIKHGSIKPYSALRFGIKLVDIYRYEVPAGK